jgi:sulfoxide reductase heme-binding subunit YedZ
LRLATLKPVVFVLCLAPMAWLFFRAFTGGLSANPIDDITDISGTWTLRFLLIGLAITPLRRVTGWNALIRYRRMIGLFAFAYVCLHFCTYLVFDHFFDVVAIWDDVAKRRYITAGFTAFLLLIPLAVTSTTGWIRRLGGKRWAQLHRLVYAAAILGVVHFLWLVKGNDLREPLVYGAVLVVLLAARLPVFRKPVQARLRTGR